MVAQKVDRSFGERVVGNIFKKGEFGQVYESSAKRSFEKVYVRWYGCSQETGFMYLIEYIFR